VTLRVLVALVAVSCHGGDPRRPRAAGRESLSIAIHAGRDPAMAGRAHVDERRWRDVPARGTLDLGAVASGLELDSVVVESESDPGALTTRSCDVVAAAAGLREAAWLWGRAVTVHVEGGPPVEGVVVEVGDPMAVIEDEDAGTRARAPRETVRPDADEPSAHGGPPEVGDLVHAVDRDGRDLYGRFVAVVPERLVVRAAGGAPTSVPPERITRLAVDGVTAEPILRCEIESRRPGRHLVRVTYATTGVAWAAAHTIAAPRAESIELATAYTITAGALSSPRVAQVQLVLGLPGDSAPPETVWRGEATIGGGTVRVTAAPVSRRARLDRVFRGAEEDPAGNPRRVDWREGSVSSVWRELAFERAPGDAPGPVRVAVRDEAGVRWIDGEIPPRPAGEGGGGAVRVPLAVEPALVGYRRRLGRELATRVMVDEVTYSVANRGDTAVVVLVEEPLRGLVRPTVLHETHPGELLRDRWRATLEVPAGGIAQGSVVLQYRLRR